jgi:hypothetical protein
MRKASEFLARMCLAILLLASNAWAGAGNSSFLIDGYASGAFAVTSEVQAQVASGLGMLPTIDEEHQLVVEVVGHSDGQGSRTVKDDIASRRASEVATYIKSLMPEAQVLSWSAGDEADLRQVVVRYAIVAKPATKQVPAPVVEAPVVITAPAQPEVDVVAVEDRIVLRFAWAMVVSGVIGLLLIAIGYGIYRFVKRLRHPAPKTVWGHINVRAAEKDFRVRIEKVDGEWVSPVRGYKSKDRADVKRSLESDLRSYFKHLSGEDVSPAFVNNGWPEKIRQLIDNNIIAAAS